MNRADGRRGSASATLTIPMAKARVRFRKSSGLLAM